MQISLKQLSTTKVQLNLVADNEMLEHVHSHVVEEMGRGVQVAGFRKGHAPANVVEKSLDQQTLQAQFVDHALNEMYGRSIVEKKLRPVGQPAVKISKFVPFKTLEVEMEVDVVGDIKLPDYKKFSFKPAVVEVEDKDVEAVIDDLLARDAEKKPVERAAKDGDEVLIDFTGVDAKTKEAIAGADGNSYPLTIGSNTFIPGFEPELVGLKAGDEKTFDITFPKDYGAKELQKRKVSFTVTAKEVREVALPKLDEKFVAKVGPFKTVAELRNDIRKQIKAEKDHQAARALENDLLTELAKKTKVDIPAVLIEDEVERMIAEQKQNILYRGQTWQEFLSATGKTEEEYRKELAEQAELRVKTGIALGEVAQAEDLEVSETELNARIDELKAHYKDEKMQAELAKSENQRDIASRILTEKAVKKLVDYAVK